MAGFQHIDTTLPTYLPPLTATGRAPDGHAAIAAAYAQLSAEREALEAKHGARLMFGTPALTMVLKFHDYEAWLLVECILLAPPQGGADGTA